MSLSPRPYDAVVVGAGPAGAVTARLLARGGWHVALVEKTAFPRPKVCGAFLSATAMPLLEACGIAQAYDAVAGPTVTRLGLYAGATIAASPGRRAWGRALDRATLDTLLRDAAAQAGVTLFQPAQAVGVTRDAVTLDDGLVLQARHVVAAAGSWATKGPLAITAPSDLFAFKAHFRQTQLPPGLMPLLAFPGGYGGMVHSDDGRMSLSFCIAKRALDEARRRHGGKAGAAALAHLCATTRGAALALEGASLEGAILATGPIHPGIRPRIQDGVFVVGNGAGESHAIIAEGISMAIQGGGLLAKALLAGRGADYPAVWHRAFATRIRAAALFAGLAMHSGPRNTMRRVIAALPRILDWGAGLAGKS